MADFVISVFRLRNERGFAAPQLHFEYIEKDTGAHWFMDFGGTRLYLVRTAESLDKRADDQIDDSHFMARRVTSALLMGGAGLFVAGPAGRLFFTGVEGRVQWGQDIDRLNPEGDTIPEGVTEGVGDWYRALCEHTVLRRALDDAHLALQHPQESITFVYRGLEWIKRGLGIRWEDLAAPLGVSVKDIREFKKMANHESGVRHASLSGRKLRANIYEDIGVVCGLFDGINFARSQLDATYKPMSVPEIAATVMRATRPRAYD